jgi:hypothetical protein
MAKIKTYRSVQDWVDAEFKIQIRDGKSLSEQTLSISGKILTQVHKHSPADLLGLRAGDILYAINGGIFDVEDLEKSFRPRKLRRSYSFDFLRPETRKKIQLKGSTFPFGAQFGQSKDSFIAELRNGSPDPADTYQFWKEGQSKALSEILPAFEAFNIRLVRSKGNPFDGELPKTLPYNTELASGDIIWPGHFTWLALCAAHAEQWDRANFILKYVEDHFEHSGDGGMMSMFAAMAYIRSMLAEQKGQLDVALDHIHHAIDMSPETDVLYKRLSTLTQADAVRPVSPHLGVKLAYNLPQQDPTQRFKQTQGHLSLDESLAKLSPGQFILVCLMSSYRTNSPYVEGFTRAHTPLAKLKDVFQAVHVITSWDKATSKDLNLPIMEEKLTQSGINVSVLFDAEQTLAEQLSLVSSPTNLIINHHGCVVADGWLGDDAVLWDALSTS